MVTVEDVVRIAEGFPLDYAHLDYLLLGIAG